MRGFYVLFIKLEEPLEIRVGKLGIVRLPAGWYAYVGKAVGISLERRLRRHFKRNKKPRRHIDYITTRVRPHSVYRTDSVRSEHELVELLKQYGRKEIIKGFGSSDDPRSYSHLLYSSELRIPVELSKFPLDKLDDRGDL